MGIFNLIVQQQKLSAAKLTTKELFLEKYPTLSVLITTQSTWELVVITVQSNQHLRCLMKRNQKGSNWWKHLEQRTMKHVKENEKTRFYSRSMNQLLRFRCPKTED